MVETIKAPQVKPTPAKESDKWYTPPKIEDLVTQVLEGIDLDPCADEGKHIAAARHYTASDDGLSQEWHGRVFMNPPYSCPGKWVAKLQAEIEAGRVMEAIALVPAATDTNWLSPVIESQPICFWKGRIKFLDTSYQPKQSARQSHCLVYWGTNGQKFKQVFDEVGVVKMPEGKWNPAHFGDVPYKADGNQLTIFCDYNKPPEPDDIRLIPDYEQAWAEWEHKALFEELIPLPDARCPMPDDSYQPKDKNMKFQFSATHAIAEQIAQLQEQLNQLTATLKPYQECEQKAEELRREVAEYGCEMTGKIPQDEILNWAKSLYSAASGVQFVEGDSGVIAAQNEAISTMGYANAQLRAELAAAQKCEEKANAQRNEALMQLAGIADERDKALDKIADITEDRSRVTRRLQTTQDRHAQVLQELKDLKEQTDVATIEVLQKENISLISQIQSLEILTDDMDAQLAEQQLMPEVEALKQENYELMEANKKLQIQREDLLNIYTEDTRELVQISDVQQACTKILAKGDIVQTPDNLVGTITGYAYANVIVKLVNGEYQFQRNQLKWISTPEKSNEKAGEITPLAGEVSTKEQGVVVGMKNNSVAVLFDATDDRGQHETVLSASHLKATTHPDIASLSKGREFIASLKSKVVFNNLTWSSVSEVCQNNPVVLREMCHTASTKLQKDFTNIDNLARLMSEYVLETGDITDFGWLDEIFVAKVEALVEAKKSLPYHKDDWVQNLETGAIWQVRNFDGEWLLVIAGNKITSLHKSEVKLLVQEEVAA
ncbi:hypothetical protein LC605_24095 [Nostoc sp. CHAB 5836]|uniref:DNA N-6-adenine-methyltransferase n=1 Tax=Nostoc sp. CHAB 5836 TaxID=2780404 RepID=UPI001E295706|nr:DNA N-6-adenine-methyltransferase [Nostoc sp. CHAB 5836]MCC5618110.1 hypothetical protein [Nostoc sp. CHAB 5836]